MTARQGRSAVLTSNAHLGQVDLHPVEPTEVLEGHPLVGSTTLAEARGVEVGLWEITPGTVVDIEVDEVFVVLSGRGRVMFEDSSYLTLAPGSIVQLRSGDRTTWTIEETLRKVYVLLPDNHAAG